jgi:hypothetical protein
LTMRQLWHDLRTHRWAALLFLLLWAATWLITIGTWERDAAGYSVGMSSVAIPFHLVLPVALGALVGLAWSAPSRPFWRACALVGLVFGIIHFALLLLVDAVWLPEVEAGPSPPDMAAEALAFAATYAIMCVVLSVIGGGVGRALAARLRDRA